MVRPQNQRVPTTKSAIGFSNAVDAVRMATSSSSWSLPFLGQGAPPSETDDLYTPQNDFFYSKGPYHSLNPSSREIRLLKVWARQPLREHLMANAH